MNVMPHFIIRTTFTTCKQPAASDSLFSANIHSLFPIQNHHFTMSFMPHFNILTTFTPCRQPARSKPCNPGRLKSLHPPHAPHIYTLQAPRKVRFIIFCKYSLVISYTKPSFQYEFHTPIHHSSNIYTLQAPRKVQALQSSTIKIPPSTPRTPQPPENHWKTNNFPRRLKSLHPPNAPHRFRTVD